MFAQQTTMNMELPPRNSTPLRVKGKRQSLSFRRRRPQQSAIEMHLVANGASPRNTSNSGHANGSLPDADSVLFHGGSKGGDDNTLDDLSKYAYSDCGGEYNLKDESQSQHQDEFGQAALEGMAGCADPAVQQQQQQQHDEYGYVEDNKSLNLLQMMSGGESLTSNVMEAMNRSKGNNSQTPSGSEDLNQVSLTSFSQDDIMSAMAAEDSINLQRETMHDSMQEDIMNQHLIHQLITDSNSKNRNNTQESNQKDAPNPTNTTNPEGPNNQEIEFNPHESFHNNSQDGSDQEGAQPLTDLEKSILAAQAMAMAAEIDSPLHLNRNGRRRPDQKEMIPPGLQEVYVPDHKRLKQKQKKKKEERRQQKHSSLSPFVLKRNGTNGTTDSYITNNDSLTKPIVDQDLESDTDNSKGDHSNSNKSNANTAQAQRKAKQRKAAAKSILAKRSPSNSKDGSVSTGGSKTSSSDKNNNNNNVPSSPNRGTAHAVPNQPNNLPRHNSTRDLTTTQQRPAQSLKRVKSLGCLFNSNQARLLAKEETERDDVVLFEARKYEDIQYVNVMEVSEEEEESDEDTIESDTQTLKSRMSRMSRSIKRAFVSRKEMSNRRKAEQKRKAQQDEGHHYRQEEQEQVADANSNAIPQNENSDEDNTRASSGLSKSTFSRRQMLVRSISKTIRNSFRVGKSKLKSKASKTNSNGDQQEQEEVSLGLEFGDCSHKYYNKEVGYIGNQVHMNDSLNNSKDIVFEPDIIEEEPEDMFPGFGEELDVDEMQDEFDVDELSNLRKSESWQQKQQEQQLYQEEKKIEEEQPNRPLSPNSRPNMALARSTSGSALVDMNSQDLTVVLGNSSSSVNRRLSRLDTARRHGFKNPSIDSLWEETTVRSRDSRNSKSSKSSRRRGNDSLRRPKGPPNTRYSRNQRAALNKLNLGDVVDSSLDASTHSLPNKKAKGGATTKSNKNGNSSPRTHKRSVSMDEGDLQDRRGSF